MGVEVLRSALTALVERLAPLVGHVRTLAIPLRDDDTPDPDALEVFRSGQMSAVSALRLAKAALRQTIPR